VADSHYGKNAYRSEKFSLFGRLPKGTRILGLRLKRFISLDLQILQAGQRFWLMACMLIDARHRGTAMSMTCRATIRLICEYLEGRLSPEVAGEFQRHISYCHDCRTVFDAAALTLEVYFDREVEPASIDRSRVA
jgi:Putative zinc-finger